MVLAKNNDKPLTLNASIIANGISSIIVLSCSIKTFFTAGSNNHAIVAVPIATQKDKEAQILTLYNVFLRTTYIFLIEFFLVRKNS